MHMRVRFVHGEELCKGGFTPGDFCCIFTFKVGEAVWYSEEPGIRGWRSQTVTFPVVFKGNLHIIPQVLDSYTATSEHPPVCVPTTYVDFSACTRTHACMHTHMCVHTHACIDKRIETVSSYWGFWFVCFSLFWFFETGFH